MKKCFYLLIFLVLLVSSCYFIFTKYNQVNYTRKQTYENLATSFIKVINEVSSVKTTNFTINVYKDSNTYWSKTFKLNGDPAENLFIINPKNADYYINEVVPMNYLYSVQISTDGTNYSDLEKSNNQYKFTISDIIPKVYLKVRNTYNNTGGFTADSTDNVSAKMYSYPTLQNVIENSTYQAGTYDNVNRIFTGLSPNNYLWYSGFMWRIIGINPDGSIKIITDQSLASLNYHSTSNNLYGSYIYKWLDETSSSNLYDGVFYNSLNSANNFIQSSLLCAGSFSTDECNTIKSFNGKVGLLRYSEYVNAGGADSYLNISEYQWTMNTNSSSIKAISNTGDVVDVIPATVCGVRPVAVLKNSVLVSSGDGSSASPYRLVGDSSAVSNTQLNNRYSGEYVNYSGMLWRIVGINNDNTTKIILNSSYGNRAFNSNVSAPIPQLFKLDNSESIGFYLLNTFYNNLSNKSYVADGTWYLGQWERTSDYSDTINNSTGNYAPATAKVGLIRIGELFSGSDLNDSTSLLHTITPKVVGTFDGINYTIQHTNVVSSTGQLATASQSEVTYTNVAVRPVLNLISNICITNGLGTSSSPYNIGECS